MKRLLILMALVGCGESGEIAAMRLAFENAKETVVGEQKATTEKTEQAVEILKDNTAALARIETKLEASLAKSEPQNGKDGDPASALNPPAKANTALAPLKVATPGDSSRIASDGTVLKWNIEGNWNPTILETSAHLAKEHGIDTNGMTHQEMADIHAALHDGKTEEQAVSGAIFQRSRASAVTSQRYAFRPLSRGPSAVSWQGNSTQQSCPSGRCPVRRSR